MAGNRYPHEGIATSGAGSKPNMSTDGQISATPMNDGLGHRVPAPASGDGSALGEVRPGGTQGEQVPAPGGVAPEFARPGGPEEI